MNYADLEIGLHKWQEDSYAVELRYVDSKNSSEERLERPNPYLVQFDPINLREQAADPAGYGRLLSKSLFVDDVKTFFENARVKADALQVPLRLRLVIGRSAPRLHSLRWETLRDPRDDSPLVTSERILFSRYLSSSYWQSVRPFRNDEPLRALVVIANPTDIASWKVGERKRELKPIAVDSERKRARLGLSTTTITELAERGEATLDNLIDNMRDGCDILYLVCHGELVRNRPRLWLENEQGNVATIDGGDLVTRLKELQHQPRLVVLASCQSAGDGEEARLDDNGALAALGPRLAEEVGIPAVLAMQGNITMRTMEEFMPVLFRELQKDGQIDRAVAVARGMVRNRMDSWMPVLFMRLRSGEIWYTPGLDKSPPGFSKWPSLLQHISEGNCTPILGFGMVESLLGSSHEIAQHWAETYDFPMAPHDREDLPQVAQYLAVNQDLAFPGGELRRYLRREILRRFGRERQGELQAKSLDDLMLEAVGARRQNPDVAEPHAVLADLPFRVYVTTNADSLMTDALTKANKEPQMRFFDWQRDMRRRRDDEREPDAEREPDIELEKLQLARPPGFGRWSGLACPPIKRPVVYYLFGYLDEPRSLVLTEDDYFDYLIGITMNRDLMPNVVRSVLADSALLFLGFRIDDWNFRVLFRSIMHLQGGNRRRNYTSVAVQIDPERYHIADPGLARRYLESYFQNANINIYWGSVDEFVKELRSRWENYCVDHR